MKTLLAVPLVVLLPWTLQAQTCPDPGTLDAGQAPAAAVVRFLADDALEGRLAGSAGERCAGDYIAARFHALGLAPGGDDGYFADVRLASVLDPHGAAGGTGRNVIGVLDGADGALRSEVIVIGAHYDHLGHGVIGSLDPEPRGIHNGADDNASGVAALLRVAEQLTRAPRPARTIVFVAFTGEELGLLGSKASSSAARSSPATCVPC
jgi:acetylornithine deacetylase/succinyl-diaminopimelate desuccinylase-like protein